MSKYDKYIGTKIGYATIKSINGRKAFCLCDCGNTFETRIDALLSGNTKSCGCYHRETLKEKFTTHGKSKHPLYKTWHNIRSRCKNPNATKYNIYGGRGIKICPEWDNNFMNFYEWSIENGWKQGLTIDRIDSNGNYCPENCRWVDYYKQNNNLKSNHIIEYKGEKHSVYEWAHIIGISEKTFSERIRRGWNVERAIETPVIHRKKVVK